ncbi:hypothetical protein [Ammonifex thiophilus]|uniref:Uncharacterized protein n=1 Tax=Ammonifex thiophilus TaxID=444093 RepID=A0A3D8P3K6_9THEO|nr:hypothetical protein [Ammonifex thiophilus]RDV81797.1 hypothetical protein DXX99_08840 [Ammonifex thiophilus]
MNRDRVREIERKIEFAYFSSPGLDKEAMLDYLFRPGERVRVYRFLERPFPDEFHGLGPEWPVALAVVLGDGRWVWREVPTFFYTPEEKPAYDPELGGYPDWRLGRYWPGVLRSIPPEDMPGALEYHAENANGVTVGVQVFERVCFDPDTASDEEAVASAPDLYVDFVPPPPAGVSLWRYLSELGQRASAEQTVIWEAWGQAEIEAGE